MGENRRTFSLSSIYSEAKRKMLLDKKSGYFEKIILPRGFWWKKPLFSTNSFIKVWHLQKLKPVGSLPKVPAWNFIKAGLTVVDIVISLGKTQRRNLTLTGSTKNAAMWTTIKDYWRS